VIITGSRNWDSQYKIHIVLNELFALADALQTPLTIKHGACPTGADLTVDQWIIGKAGLVLVERYPADWKRWGKSAGPRRNEIMVASGADMCIGFLRNNSLGTRNALVLAKVAKIPTFVVDYDPDQPVSEEFLRGQ
jgi:hypothetical protein